MNADIFSFSFDAGNAVFTVHLQSGFYRSHGTRWQVLHCHPCYELHLFEKGGFDFYSGGSVLRVLSPSALLIRPLVYHSFYSESDGAERVCLLFDLNRSGDGDAFDDYSALLSSLSDNTVVHDFVSALSLLRGGSGRLRPYEEKTVLKNRISDVMVELFSRLRETERVSETPFPANEKKSGKSILAEIFKFIEDNYSKETTPADLVAELFVSQRQLERLLKTEMQTTFTELLNRCRIENVRKQLDKAADIGRLSQIAEENGFPDYTTFWRNFKKYTGKSPSDYIGSSGDYV